ncbi:Cell division control protein 73 [Candida viswanathii]|uniref:Cell division control protein 73 n=1 Tax=Candida viswanathii TaxID=5486 RepID=A0A367Y5L7_9ASCO|nr:Cell division control protein 73 [Candida viswanathii]
MSSSTGAPLRALRKATTKGEPVVLFKDGEKTESIVDATEVQFGQDKTKYDLNMTTNFYSDDNFEHAENLRSVVFCYLLKKSNLLDYREESENLGIPLFKFLVRTDLLTWLNGDAETCQFVKDEKVADESAAAKTSDTIASESSKKHKLEDDQLERISKFERESIDHNAALRGSKNIDFGYLISDAKRLILELKRSKSTPGSNSRGGSKEGPKKQPIILVSPATTALLSLSNIKEFLEEGRFTEPNPSNRPDSGLVMVNHPSDKLISSGQRIMVVDNIENFTKLEYWERVIAIFTTGQTWQFSRYIHPEPENLFQKYRGFYFGYQGETAPAQIKDWNVTEVRVDRDKRFKDKVVVKDFWTEIDKILINKGYGKLY